LVYDVQPRDYGLLSQSDVVFEWGLLTSTAVIDPSERLPTIFIDEKAMLKTLKRRGVIDANELEHGE